MEILLWLAPAAIVTVVTMCWVAWWGRQDRDAAGVADAETAARRLGEALDRAARRAPASAATTHRRTVDPSSGVALRTPRPRPVPAEASRTAEQGPAVSPDASPDAGPDVGGAPAGSPAAERERDRRAS